MFSAIRDSLFAQEPSIQAQKASQAPLPPLEPSPDPEAGFLPLSISFEAQTTICNLIEELATQSIWYLGSHSARLTELGATLKETVHPYLFLIAIFSNPSTKQHMIMIFKEKNHLVRGRIWSDFVYNLGRNFEDRAEEIAPYRASFAEALNVVAEDVALHERDKNWDALVTLLIIRGR